MSAGPQPSQPSQPSAAQACGMLATATAVGATAQHLGALASRLDRVLDEPARTGGWEGRSADSANRLLRRRAGGIRSVSAALEIAEHALTRAGGVVGDAAARAASAGADLLAAATGPVTPRSPLAALLVGAEVALPGPSLPVLLALPGVAKVELDLRESQLHAAAATASCAAVLTSAADRCRAVRRGAEPYLLRAALVDHLGPRASAAWLATVPAVDSSAEEVATWWSAHTALERSRLYAAPSSAAAVGALDGLPAAVRDRANRAVLARRIASWSQRRSAPEPELAMAAHQIDLRVLDELERIRIDPATGARVPVLLISYDPDAWSGRGRVALALGQPDSAAHVSYVVPGLGQHVDSGLADLTDEAWRLYAATRRLSTRPAVATVAWLGYDAPDLPQVAFEHRAEEGAIRLAREVSGLRAARGDDQPHVTLVGHSYGSVVAGLTVLGAPGVVDDLAVVGSPGISVDHADDLPVPDGHVWVGAASGDPVSHLSRFGVDPAAASFGGRRFPAESALPIPFLAQHFHYFDAGSPSVASLARIVADDGAGLPTVPGRKDHGYLGAGGELLLPPLLMALLHHVPDPTFDDPAATVGAAP